MNSSEFDTKEFDKTLTKVMKAEERIKRVMLVDKSGLTISQVSGFAHASIDVDSIGVIAGAVFYASEEQGKSLHIGDLGIVTSEFVEGKIFASACGQAVLCVITSATVNIGIVRLVMKKACKELGEGIDQYVSSSKVSSDELSGEVGVISKPHLQQNELEAALKELERL
jgi:predicted regulator of Ras-like GTPase activity (Roadblock/LC7/MglB family)